MKRYMILSATIAVLVGGTLTAAPNQNGKSGRSNQRSGQPKFIDPKTQVQPLPGNKFPTKLPDSVKSPTKVIDLKTPVQPAPGKIPTKLPDTAQGPKADPGTKLPPEYRPDKNPTGNSKNVPPIKVIDPSTQVQPAPGKIPTKLPDTAQGPKTDPNKTLPLPTPGGPVPAPGPIVIHVPVPMPIPIPIPTPVPTPTPTPKQKPDHGHGSGNGNGHGHGHGHHHHHNWQMFLGGFFPQSQSFGGFPVQQRIYRPWSPWFPSFFGN